MVEKAQSSRSRQDLLHRVLLFIRTPQKGYRQANRLGLSIIDRNFDDDDDEDDQLEPISAKNV